MTGKAFPASGLRAPVAAPPKAVGRGGVEILNALVEDFDTPGRRVAARRRRPPPVRVWGHHEAVVERTVPRARGGSVEDLNAVA